MSLSRFLCATALMGVTMSLPGIASAQTTAAEAAGPVQTDANGQAAPTDDVVVTGSRIRRPDLDSASPVAVIGQQQIQSQGIVNTQDLLQKLPQVGIPGLSRANSNFLTSGNGIATINLRNLGDSRTLVLVNGRRFVPGVAGTSIVDINNIPADFIERFEVVTGGASAVYGSDAIAGVVNYILRTDIDGIIARGQYGITDRGDNATYNASLSGGTKFGADGRGSVIANVTYSKEEGLLSRNRAISAQDCSAAGCGPQSYSSYAPQGRFEFQNADGASSNDG